MRLSGLKFRTRKGFTLIEVMLVVALGAMLTFVIATLLNAVRKAGQRIEDNIIATGTDILGTRQIWFDLRRAGMSFNLLQVASDDPAGASFYDLVSDSTCPSGRVDCTRTYTLTVPRGGAAPKTLPMVVSSGGLPPPVALNPLSFFTVTPGATLSQRGTLRWQEATMFDRIAALDPHNRTDRALLSDGRLLLFYSPLTIRPPRGFRGPNATDTGRRCLIADSGTNQMQIPPKMVTFVGQYNRRKLTNGPFDWMTRQCHPSMDLELNSVETFFRTMPPVGGTGTVGMVMPIEVIRYRMEAVEYEGRTTGQLVRESYGRNGWEAEHIVAVPVISVEFTRRSIATPSIFASITPDKGTGVNVGAQPVRGAAAADDPRASDGGGGGGGGGGAGAAGGGGGAGGGAGKGNQAGQGGNQVRDPARGKK